MEKLMVCTIKGMRYEKTVGSNTIHVYANGETVDEFTDPNVLDDWKRFKAAAAIHWKELQQ